MEVRKAEVQRFQYGGKKLLISDKHKILLEEGEEEPLPTDCLGQGAMQKTNFERLFIYEREPRKETVSRMQSTEVDLELETRVTEDAELSRRRLDWDPIVGLDSPFVCCYLCVWRARPATFFQLSH